MHDTSRTLAQSSLIVRSNGERPSLSTHTLVRLQENHDSQVAKHKGNKRSNIAREDVYNLTVCPPNTKLNPSQCSKLVAVLMRESHSAPTGVSRIHRWNMSVKLNVSDVLRNTSTRLGQTEVCFEEGGISKTNPVEHGKFLIMIKNHVSHLCVHF